MKKRFTVAMLVVVFFLIAIFDSTESMAEGNNVSNDVAYVFIGDSRTVGMNMIVNFKENDNMFMVAEVGAGLNWFKTYGSKKLKEIRKNNEFDSWVYVFNLGVNDVYLVDSYIELIKELEKEATVYVVSVNPTVDTMSNVKCKDIKKFNDKIISEFYNYIDSYNYLIDDGFGTRDGVHYDNATYTKLYDFIMKEIEVKIIHQRIRYIKQTFLDR